METDYLKNLNGAELEHQMDVNAVLLLRDMHETEDLHLRQHLFEQAADQEASLMSEVLEGAVVTDFRFDTQEGKLYLLQPNAITDWQRMHEHGVLRARAKTAEDLGYSAYYEMAKAELEESYLQERMVQDGRPAAMVKLSLCGIDVMGAGQLEKLGRNPDAQRAFLRVSVFDGQNMHIHSRSIDGLSLTDGRGIATGWGLWEEPQMVLDPGASSVDILSNQLFFDQTQMSTDQMHQLADRLVSSFDALQTRRTGKSYKAGRAPEGIDTYRFVLSNQDLLTAHMESLVNLAGRRDLPIGHLAALTNDLRYDIMSSFKRRMEGVWTNYGTLGESVAAAGAAERELGNQYGGCDTVISDRTAENAGYVNGRSNEINKKCVKCPSCKNIVDLPEQLLKKNIMHCVKCKSSVHTKGGKVDQQAIDEYYGVNPKYKYRFRTGVIRKHLARIDQDLALKRIKNQEELAQAA